MATDNMYFKRSLTLLMTEFEWERLASVLESYVPLTKEYRSTDHQIFLKLTQQIREKTGVD